MSSLHSSYTPHNETPTSKSLLRTWLRAWWWTREVRILSGLSLFAWLSCALYSFSIADASWFHVVLPAKVASNWAGNIGAQVSAFLMYFFGNSAWLTPLLVLLVLPIKRFIPRSQYAAQSIIGLLGVMVSISLISQLVGAAIVQPFSGGFVGLYAEVLREVLGVSGAYLVSLALLLVGGVVMVGTTLYSVLNVFGIIGMLVADMLYSLGLSVVTFMWQPSSVLWGRTQAHVSRPVSRPAHTPADMGVRNGAPQQQARFEKTQQAPQESVRAQLWPEVAEARSDVGAHRGGLAAQEVGTSHHTAQDASSRVHPASADTQNGGEMRGVARDTVAALESTQDEPAEPATTLRDTASRADAESPRHTQALSEDISDEYRTEAVDADDEISLEYDELSALEAEGADVIDDVDDLCEDTLAYDDAEEDGGHDLFDDEGDFAPDEIYTPFELPPFSLLKDYGQDTGVSEELRAHCEERGRVLEEKLQHFGVQGKIVNIQPGPVITVYEYEPDVTSKISKITALEDDLALSLKALSIRILAPVPGKNVVGFEIANEQRLMVGSSQVLNEQLLRGGKYQLPLAMGVNTIGIPVVQDLTKMPHLLVAGATGSGKSVGMNVMLQSLLFSCAPEKLRLILIDPKRLEFAPYADIPQLLYPIINNPHEVAPVLKWVVQEMERRYDIMAKAGVRNIADYHQLDESRRNELEREHGCEVSGLPYIVIMVDELADLMMVAGKDVETLIARIAQMARASGIHMIVATQRPSVDVVTGIIKVNFPSRIAFRVSTKIDSRTIVDGIGAEKLLGKGDMLYMSPTSARLQRLHGPYITDDEINAVNEYLKEQRPVRYLSLQKVIKQHSEDAENNANDMHDSLYEEVCEFIKTLDEVSISLLQRRYRVGFNRSARLIEMLEVDGYVASAQGSKPRKVLWTE